MHTNSSDTRTVVRVLVVVAMVAAMVASAFSPALAGTTAGDDLETVRATVLGKYEAKIGSLQDYKASTDNADRKAVYQEGIATLTAKLPDVQSAGDVGTLWGLKDYAYAVYSETLAAAEKVGMTPAEELARAKAKANDTVEYKIKLLEDWIAGCDDPAAIAAVEKGITALKTLFPKIEGATTPDEAYAYKDKAHAIYHSTIDAAEGLKGEEPKEKTPAEKAAEELKNARNSTLSLIEKKAAILDSAAEAASIPAVVEIFSKAAGNVESFRDAANSATTVEALAEIRAQVMEIYESAKASVADVEHVKDEEESPEHTVGGYLDRVTGWVTAVVSAAEETAERSPDTYAELLEAKQQVLARVDKVREVAESGSRLGDRWDTLNDVLRDFRRALVRHYIALGEPMVIEGLHVAG